MKTTEPRIIPLEKHERVETKAEESRRFAHEVVDEILEYSRRNPAFAEYILCAVGKAIILMSGAAANGNDLFKGRR